MSKRITVDRCSLLCPNGSGALSRKQDLAFVGTPTPIRISPGLGASARLQICGVGPPTPDSRAYPHASAIPKEVPA